MSFSQRRAGGSVGDERGTRGSSPFGNTSSRRVSRQWISHLIEKGQVTQLTRGRADANVSGASARSRVVLDLLDGHRLSGSEREDLADFDVVTDVGGVSPCDAFSGRERDDVGEMPNRCAWLTRLLVVFAHGRYESRPLKPQLDNVKRARGRRLRKT